jgi:5-methyltetrahydrofolate--homocysteine methyltransferase
LPTIHGCELGLDLHTGWWKPILTDPAAFDVTDLCLDEDNPGYVYAMEVLHRAAEESRGKCIPSIGAFGGPGDTLAALRGTEQLLIDCVERPEAVREAELFLMDMWCEFYDRCHALVREACDGGSCFWMDLWSPGKCYACANDFSYNISPGMFRDIFLPAVERQVAFLDHSIYHLDGVNAFGHLDAILEIEDLDAVQVLPGAGQPGPLHHMETLRKVQHAGKGLHIGVAPHEVETALAQLSARGLYLCTRCNTEAQARSLLDLAWEASVDRG